MAKTRKLKKGRKKRVSGGWWKKKTSEREGRLTFVFAAPRFPPSGPLDLGQLISRIELIVAYIGRTCKNRESGDPPREKQGTHLQNPTRRVVRPNLALLVTLIALVLGWVTKGIGEVFGG